MKKGGFRASLLAGILFSSTGYKEEGIDGGAKEKEKTNETNEKNEATKRNEKTAVFKPTFI